MLNAQLRFLSFIVIEDINHELSREQHSIIVYYYFDFANKVHSSKDSLLRSVDSCHALVHWRVVAVNYDCGESIDGNESSRCKNFPRCSVLQCYMTLILGQKGWE